jgi:hypothetical protein
MALRTNRRSFDYGSRDETARAFAQDDTFCIPIHEYYFLTIRPVVGLRMSRVVMGCLKSNMLVMGPAMASKEP